MKARELVETARAILAELDDADFCCNVLFKHVFGMDYRLCFDDVDEAKSADYLSLVEKRMSGEPLQYIVGRWEFLGREYKVGPGVLIPRPETEELVDKCLELISGLDTPLVLDLCAGSGCIGISISLERPDSKVIGVEKYQEAFRYFKYNVTINNSSVDAVLEDAIEFHNNVEDCSVDLIVSNPPYITETAYCDLQPEVKREPITALVADEDGMFFYKSFCRDYYDCLKPGGHMAFEIGYDQKEAVTKVFSDNQFKNIVVLNDSYGNPRIAIAEK